jgi:aconitate hydratase 2/2-methylisocitrate dehydratase
MPLNQLARIGYENILYLERPGCNLCMGNKKSRKRGYSNASTRLFKVVEDSEGKKENPYFHQHLLLYCLQS